MDQDDIDNLHDELIELEEELQAAQAYEKLCDERVDDAFQAYDRAQKRLECAQIDIDNLQGQIAIVTAQLRGDQ